MPGVPVQLAADGAINLHPDGAVILADDGEACCCGPALPECCLPATPIVAENCLTGPGSVQWFSAGARLRVTISGRVERYSRIDTPFLKVAAGQFRPFPAGYLQYISQDVAIEFTLRCDPVDGWAVEEASGGVQRYHGLRHNWDGAGFPYTENATYLPTLEWLEPVLYPWPARGWVPNPGDWLADFVSDEPPAIGGPPLVPLVIVPAPPVTLWAQLPGGCVRADNFEQIGRLWVPDLVCGGLPPLPIGVGDLYAGVAPSGPAVVLQAVLSWRYPGGGGEAPIRAFRGPGQGCGTVGAYGGSAELAMQSEILTPCANDPHPPPAMAAREEPTALSLAMALAGA